MQLPTIPTDNLYKFLAISGLTLFLVSPLYYHIFGRSVELETIAIIKENNLFDLEIKTFREDMEANNRKRERLTERGIKLEAELTAILPSSQAKDTKQKEIKADLVKNYEDEMLEQINEQKIISLKQEELYSKLKEQSKQNIEIDAETQKLLVDSRYLKALWWTSQFGFLLGLSLFFGGLYLWYIRVQKFQDKILIKESMQNATENQSK